MDEEGHANLGAIQDTIYPESRFALQHQARAEANKAFVLMDTSKGVQRALLRTAKPIPYKYTVGDIVTFRRDKGGKTVCSPASRVIVRENVPCKCLHKTSGPLLMRKPYCIKC